MHIKLHITAVNATVLFFSFFPSLDYMLGLRDLNTFPMEKKKPIALEFGVFVLTK